MRLSEVGNSKKERFRECSEKNSLTMSCHFHDHAHDGDLLPSPQDNSIFGNTQDFSQEISLNDDVGLALLSPLRAYGKTRIEGNAIYLLSHESESPKTCKVKTFEVPPAPTKREREEEVHVCVKKPKLETQKIEPELTKASNTRSRTINRCVLTKSEIPESLVSFLTPKIMCKSSHVYEKNTSKGPYQGVTPYMMGGVQNGWGAQLQNKQRKQMIRIGTFDDIEVAALTFTAAYIDHTLIDEPLKARDWMESMCLPESKQLLETWISSLSQA